MPNLITTLPDLAPLEGVRFDDRTQQGLLLPNPGNSQRLDARRIAYSLLILDQLMGEVLTETEVRSIITGAVAALVDASPTALDTLNELAAAINDDPNFAATIAAQIGAKANSNNAALTGTPTAPTAAVGTNTTQLATTAFAAAAVAALSDLCLKIAGGTLTGPLSFTPGTLDVLTGGTKAVNYTAGNRRRFELRSGANVLNVTNIPESGGDLELDLLYTAGTLGFTQTINWSIGGGAKSTAIGDTGLALAAGQRYAVVLWNMGGAIYGAIG